MVIYNSILDLVGKTPIVKLSKISQEIPGELFGKVESFNPGASIKDRVALHMIERAEQQGLLKGTSEIIEATSGNTGIGLALVCAVKGYSLTIVMPETMSPERRKIIQTFGAKVVLTPGKEGMKGAVQKAQEMAEKIEGSFIPNQFQNTHNPEVHRKTTALEVWNDMNQQLNAVIIGVGTGGTITGIGETLKKLDPQIKIIAVEPAGSPLLSEGKKGSHKITGIGAGFIPEILNKKIIDNIITVTDNEASETMKLLAKKEGIFAGPSSGAAVAAGLKYGKQVSNKKRIVIILPDSGERYLSEIV
ncbi:MAG: cysteine synthase A [Candidatus Heimdallarchaeota archaeon]|nr:cysteine synthase A [Candidatus Heimdallarchaeota archaeon]